MGASIPLTGPLVPLTRGHVPLTGLFQLFSCWSRAWAFNCQGVCARLRLDVCLRLDHETSARFRVEGCVPPLTMAGTCQSLSRRTGKTVPNGALAFTSPRRSHSVAWLQLPLTPWTIASTWDAEL